MASMAQAMDLASFEDVRRLEKTLGPDRLAEAMRKAPRLVGRQASKDRRKAENGSGFNSRRLDKGVSV